MLGLIGKPGLEEEVPLPALERVLAAHTNFDTGVLDHQALAGDLAERYGVARSAVIQFLRSRGVTIRRPRLTEEELAQVVALYQEGVRQIDIAERLGRTKGVIWHALRRVGAL